MEIPPPRIPHYYGNVVRRLFMAAGVVLLIAILIDRQLLLINLTFGIIGLLIITGLAGLTNPRSRLSVKSDAIFAAVMFLFFEYFAVASYNYADTFFDPVFVLRQTLAFLFIIAFYFSIKTLRGMPAE